MSKKEQLLLRLLSKSDANFDLEDIVNILLRLGFEERKTGEVTGYSRYKE